jgi:hypothetical protein
LTAALAAAQISRMFRAFAIAVRTSYLLTVLTVLACAVYATVEFAHNLSTQELAEHDLGADLVTAALLVTFLLLPLRALSRTFVLVELVPGAHLRDRPVVATLVMVSGLLGCGLFLLIARILLDLLPSTADLNFAGPLMLALLLMAFSLLAGELVLVGRVHPRQA